MKLVPINRHVGAAAEYLRKLAEQVERGEIRVAAAVSIDREDTIEMSGFVLPGASENDKLVMGGGLDRMKFRFTEDYWEHT